MGTMRTILCSRQRRRLGTLGRAGVGILGFLGSLAGCTEVVVSEQTNKPDAGRDGGSDMKDGGVTPVPLSWRWESPQPQGNNLRALWGIAGATMNDDVLYAAGESGTVLVGGATGWQLQRSAALDTRTVLGLAGQGTGASAVVLAVGQYDLGLRRQNGQWSDLNPILGTGDGALNAIWATPTTGDFYAVGTTGRIYAIHNSGGSWVREGMGVTPDTLFAITGVPGTGSGAATEAYAVGANGRIVHRQGGNWTVEADSLVGQNLNAVWCGDGATAGQVFAAGDGGVFLVRKAGGGWAPETTPSSAQLTALWGAGDELYSVGAGGTVLQRKGGTWKQEAMGLTGELLSALWGTVRAGQATVYAVGNQGTILRRNGGVWESMSKRVTTNSLTGVWARGPQEIYAVGSDGMILRRSGPADTGSWNQIAQGVVTSSLNAISGYAPATGEADVYAVGADGTIVHKSTSGTWAVEGVILTSAELTSVWVGTDSVWVVGRSGRIGKKTQGAWSPESGPGGMPVTNDLFAVWGTGSGTAQVTYAAGASGMILRRAAGTWTQEGMGLTTQNIVSLFGSGEDNLYAFGDKGAVLRRTGGRWATSPIRQFTGAATGVAGSVHPTTGELWAAGTLGTIVRQVGADWQSEPALTTQPFKSIAIAATNDIYVVGSSGLILHKY